MYSSLESFYLALSFGCRVCIVKIFVFSKEDSDPMHIIANNVCILFSG